MIYVVLQQKPTEQSKEISLEVEKKKTIKKIKKKK